MSLARGASLFLLTLLLVACAARGASGLATLPSRAEVPAADASKPGSAADQERERRIDAFLAPGRGEIAAQGSLPPGLDQPLSKETAALLAKCDSATAVAEARAKATNDPQKAFAMMRRHMATRDQRCLDAELWRHSREGYIKTDAHAQKVIAALANAIAQSPASCASGERNPAPHEKNNVCLHDQRMIWDRAGWSCIAPRIEEDMRPAFDDAVNGYVFSFVIDRELETYEVVAEGCYNTEGTRARRTELVIRGRLGEMPKPTHFFRREAVTDS
jgi:hypothetical protein